MMVYAISNVKKELIDNFDCGIKELNIYLKNYASQNGKNNISRTFVLIEENEILGYYTLSNAQIEFENINEEMKRKLPKYPIPSIRIARLAVAKKYQKKGIGAKLLKDAFSRILLISKQTGIYFVIVDSKEESKEFYRKFGFIELNDLKSTFLIKISTIEKAYIVANKNNF